MIRLSPAEDNMNPRDVTAQCTVASRGFMVLPDRKNHAPIRFAALTTFPQRARGAGEGFGRTQVAVPAVIRLTDAGISAKL